MIQQINAALNIDVRRFGVRGYLVFAVVLGFTLAVAQGQNELNNWGSLSELGQIYLVVVLNAILLAYAATNVELLEMRRLAGFAASQLVGCFIYVSTVLPKYFDFSENVELNVGFFSAIVLSYLFLIDHIVFLATNGNKALWARIVVLTLYCFCVLKLALLTIMPSLSWLAPQLPVLMIFFVCAFWAWQIKIISWGALLRNWQTPVLMLLSICVVIAMVTIFDYAEHGLRVDELFVLGAIVPVASWLNLRHGRDYKKQQSLSAKLNVERSLISQELHDGVLNDLAGIAVISESIKNRCARNSSDVASRAETILGVTTVLSRRVRDMLTVVSTPKSWEGFIASIDNYANSMLSIKSIKFSLVCDGVVQGVPALSVSQQFQIEQIVREVIVNTLKHSGATCVVLSFSLGKGGLRVGFTDNGRGLKSRPELRAGHHMGLRNIEMRVLSMGGAVSITSPSDGGLKISVLLPLEDESLTT